MTVDNEGSSSGGSGPIPSDGVGWIVIKIGSHAMGTWILKGPPIALVSMARFTVPTVSEP